MSKEVWPEKWTKIRELGQGGQGTIFEVSSVEQPGQKGVLKLLLKDADLQARSRFAREAINLVTLSQQGMKVPRLLDDNTARYQELSIELYLVMEFVPGQTLDKVVEATGGRLPL